MKEINFYAADVQANVELSTLSSGSNSIYQGSFITTKIDIQRFNNLFLVLYQCYYHWFTKKNYLNRVFDNLTILCNSDQLFLYFQRQVQQGKDDFVHGFSFAQVIFNLCEIVVIIAPERSNFDKKISVLLGIESVERFEEFLVSQFISGEKDFVEYIDDIIISFSCIHKNTVYKGQYQNISGNKIQRIRSPHTRIRNGKIFSIGMCGSRMPAEFQNYSTLSGNRELYKRFTQSFVYSQNETIEVLSPTQLRSFLATRSKIRNRIDSQMTRLYQQGLYELFLKRLIQENVSFLKNYIQKQQAELKRLQKNSNHNLLFNQLNKQKNLSYDLILDFFELDILRSDDTEFMSVVYSNFFNFIQKLKSSKKETFSLGKIALEQAMPDFTGEVINFSMKKSISSEDKLTFFLCLLKEEDVAKKINELIKGSGFILDRNHYFNKSTIPLYLRFIVLSIVSSVVLTLSDRVENSLEKYAQKSKRNRELVIFI